MKEEFESYTEKNESFKRVPETAEENIKKLDEEYRKIIISKMGKEQKEIETEHARLSRAFGIPVGIIGTLMRDPEKSSSFISQSVLGVAEGFTRLITAGKLNDPAEQMIPNPYPENFLVFLTVGLFCAMRGFGSTKRKFKGKR